MTLDNLHLIVVILLAILIAYFSWNLFFHPLANVPAPLLTRLGIPLFRVTRAYKLTYAWDLNALHDIYGDTVRTGINIVSTIDTKAVHTIYAHESPFLKSLFYKAFEVRKNKPTLFADINPHSHAARKRSVAHLFTMKTVIDLEDYVDPYVSLLMRALDRQIISSSSTESEEKVGKVEINQWFRFFAADVVAELAYGSALGFISAGQDKDSYLSAFSNLGVFACVAGQLPSISPYINFVLRQTTTATPTLIYDLTWDRVQKRFQPPHDEDRDTERRDLLAGFMEAKNPTTKEPLTSHEITSTAMSMFAAGIDTTAGSLNAFFYFVIRNPSVYRRLQREVDLAFKEGRLQLPIRYAQGVKLPYLQACLKEAMRLYPAVGMDMPRVVPQGGMVVGEHFLPAGTEIGTSAHAFHRGSKVYGRDARVFRPERWLDITEEERAQMERNYLTFGAGSRICIGRTISLMEMSKILPTLIWRYSFSFTQRSPSSPHRYPVGLGLDGVESREEPWKLYSAFATYTEDFWCDITLRRPSDMEYDS